MQIEQRAREPAAAARRCDRDRKDFRFAAGEPRQDEAVQRAADRGAMGDDVALEQHPLELAVAPAVTERGGVQRGDRRGVARACLRQRRLAAREQPRRASRSSARQPRGVLRLRVGRAQIERLRLAGAFVGGDREPRRPRRCPARAARRPAPAAARAPATPRRACWRRCRRSAPGRWPRRAPRRRRWRCAARPACARPGRKPADRRAGAARRSRPRPRSCRRGRYSGAA